MDELAALGLVEVFDVVDESLVVLITLLHFFFAAFVGDGEAKPFVEKSHLLESRAQRFEVELDRLEGLGARPKRDHSARLVGVFTLLEGCSGHSVFKAHSPDAALSSYFDVKFLRKRVDNRDSDTMKAAGYGVAPATELSTGVQNGHDHLDGGLLFLLIEVHRDASTVVPHANGAVRANGDVNGVAVTG